MMGALSGCFVALTLLPAWSLAADPASVCEAAKLKAAGRYASCRLSADSKGVRTGKAPDYDRCETTLTHKWSRIESKGGCPLVGDVEQERAALTADAVATTWRLLDTPRFVDKGDGTIMDRKTNLTWLKHVALDGVPDYFNVHDADNEYLWEGTCTIGGKPCQPEDPASLACFLSAEGDQTHCEVCGPTEGSCNTYGQLTIWQYVVAVDASVPPGGYLGWRIPTVEELASIADRSKFHRAVDVVFHGASCGTSCADLTNPACSCTASVYYWSATSLASFPVFAWYVDFHDGNVSTDHKGNGGFHVRAVRGGS